MSFKPIQTRDITSALNALDPPFRQSVNVVKCMTVGLTDCYSVIALRAHALSSTESEGPSVAPHPLHNKSSYRDLEQIGSGAFSMVTQSQDVTGKLYAVKKIDSKFLLIALREIIFLRFMHHKTTRSGDFFLNMVDTFACGNEGVCLVLELCQYTLMDFITDLRVPGNEANDMEGDPQQLSSLQFGDEVVRPVPLTDNGDDGSHIPQPSGRRVLGPNFIRRFRHIATQLVSALSILRQEGVVHADIKPENIFLHNKYQSPSSVTPSESSYAHSESLSILLNEEFHVKLGDFGNAFHKSEVSKFYDDFSIQSLPYRSPEVLMGVPFGDKIDTWSLGIVLLELCMGSTLFVADNREELFSAMCDTFCAPPSPLLFAGGRYTSELTCSRDSSNDLSNNKVQFADHVACIYHIISSQGVDVKQLPGSLFHFLASLTHLDPDQRLNATEAMHHDFIASSLPIPISFIGHKMKQTDKVMSSLSVLRKRTPSNNKCKTLPGEHVSSAESRSTSVKCVETLGKRSSDAIVDKSRAEHKI